jgi:hypothetical protein
VEEVLFQTFFSLAIPVDLDPKVTTGSASSPPFKFLVVIDYPIIQPLLQGF